MKIWQWTDGPIFKYVHLRTSHLEFGHKELALERIKTIKIPLPPIGTQQAIVAEIEAEQALVSANRELVERMEQRIQDAIMRVWQG